MGQQIGTSKVYRLRNGMPLSELQQQQPKTVRSIHLERCDVLVVYSVCMGGKIWEGWRRSTTCGQDV
jgi:hypothetical protein